MLVLGLRRLTGHGELLDQRRTYGAGRDFGARLRNPDFVRLAESFGVRGVQVTAPDELEAAVRDAIADRRPAVVEVPCDVDTADAPPLEVSDAGRH
jgi:acetolactate synthase-1/2/3 large subunit